MACKSCGRETYELNPAENIDAKPHVCLTCGMSFSLKVQLKRHGDTHANNEPFVCISCTKNPPQSSESKSYNLRLNKKADSHTCDVCGESFPSKRSLLRHSIDEHDLDNSEASYLEESDSDDYEEPKTKRRSNSSRKTRSLGNTTKRKTNEFCFDNSEGSSNESDSDDYEKPKKKRRKSTTKPESPGKSKKKETTIKKEPYICLNCSRCFVYVAAYDKHVERCLAEKTAPVSSKGNKKSKKTVDFESMKHECGVCGKGFMRKSSLEGHMVSHAQDDSDEGPDQEDFYDSNRDEDSDDYEKPIANKLKVIRKSYTCDKCNFVCFSKPTFEKHSKVHEREDIITEVKDVTAYNPVSKQPSEDKETHLCEICDKVFVTKGRLKKHLQFHVTREEEGDKEPAAPPQPTPVGRIKRSKIYQCDDCGKQFSGLTCFNKHAAKHHNNHDPDPTDPNFRQRPKPVKKKFTAQMECEYCHEIFEGKRSVYMKHLQSHTPEVCGICDERFVDRASLVEHCKVHVGTEEGRMFVECSQKALEAKLGIMPPEPKVEYIYLMVR